MCKAFRLLLFLLPAIWFSLQTQAQSNPGMMEDTTGGQRLGKIQIEAYIDAYIGSFFRNSGKTVDALPYFVNHAITNQATVNLAYLDFRYSTEKIRSRIIPAFGTYMEANYPNSKTGLLMEASVGFRISRKTWLDAGILPSPISNETPLSKDHLMFTRSLAAEFVPYYFNGIRFQWNIRENLKLYAYLVNNWTSNVPDQYTNNRRYKSGLLQSEWKPKPGHLFNLNLFAGPENRQAMMPLPSPVPNGQGFFSFADLYYVYAPEGGPFSLTTCTWMGHLRWNPVRANESKSRSLTRQVNLIAAYEMAKGHKISGRAEIYQQQIQTQNPNGKWAQSNQIRNQVASLGIGYAYQVYPGALVRLEGRHFLAPQHIQNRENAFSDLRGTWAIVGASFSY